MMRSTGDSRGLLYPRLQRRRDGRRDRGWARRLSGGSEGTWRAAAPVTLVRVALALIAGSLPAAASAAAVSSSSAALVTAPAVGAATAGVPSFPPCIDLAFEAGPVTGVPPLTFTWVSDTLEELSGNPVVIDTTGYPAGPHQMLLTVTNAFGSDQAVVPFDVEALVAGLPEAAQNPVATPVVTIDGAANGYNEWRFVWGDGQATTWQPACIGPTVHTYSAPGTYPVQLEVRNCLEGPVASDPLLVTVGAVNLAVTEFAALGCDFGVCAFTTGEELTFEQSFSLPPAMLSYDWDGDGAIDELAATPVATHAYAGPGLYRPSVTARWGSEEVTRVHDDWIYISDHPQPLAFYDGFEEGDVGCWSQSAGAPPATPGPGCFVAP